MKSSALLEAPTAVKHQTYAAFACGTDNNMNTQVVGLTTGKTPGVPVFASNQTQSTAPGGWHPDKTPLTFANPVPLSGLVLCSGRNLTDAIGLGHDGKIYRAGRLPPGGTWQPGGGMLNQTQTFATGCLTAQLINTNTVFAIAPSGSPWVAAYEDYNNQWQPGYALPGGVTTAFRSMAARPDASDVGTTHAIGLTTGGAAAEIAFASGPGVGAGNWTQGKGLLGNPSVQLPGFTQLCLVTADSSGTFHVIGLGVDGSVWDIDQFAATTHTPAWTGQSVQILAAGSVSRSAIACFVTNDGAINLISWIGPSLTIRARFTTTWGASSSVIPTAGASTNWQIVNNSAYSFATGKVGAFILGCNSVGILYELAYYDGASWTAGAKTPISG